MTTLKNIAAALVKAQGEMKPPHFDSTANAGKFSYKYASLNAIRKATIDALHSNGLAIVQAPAMQDGEFGILTTLLHSSGESIEGFYPIPPNPDPQKIGSAITYAKRYSWASMCGVVADDDDDAASASQRTHTPQEQFKGQGSAPQRTPPQDKRGLQRDKKPDPEEVEKKADDWCEKYEKALAECKSVSATAILEEENKVKLDWLAKRFPDKRKHIKDLTEAKRSVLVQAPGDGVNSDDIPY